MKRSLSLIVFLFTIHFTFSQLKKTYNIGVLVDFRTDELQPLFDKLENEIKSVVGEDAIMQFPEGTILASNYSLENAKRNYNKLLNDETDIILAFGPVNAQIINGLKQHKKPTILFGAINRDLNTIDLTKATSGIKNFNYLVESESFGEDLKKFKELTGFKRIGIAVEKDLVDILPLAETFDTEIKALDASYQLIPFVNALDITSNLEDVDAVYFAGGFFLSKEDKKLLVKTFIDKKLPSFTINGTEDVELGFLATNQASENLDQFFRRIALTIEAYVNGAELANLPVYIEYTPRLTLNVNTAERINVPIKYSLIEETDFVGEFKNVISERQYTLLTAIDDALKNNLSLQASDKDISLSGQDVKSAVSNYLPSVTASGVGTYVDPDLAEISNGQNPEFSTSGNITLNQTLFSEAANANISIQKSLNKAQQENYNATALDLIFDVSNAYFTSLILKANAQIQIRNLDLTKRNLQIAEQNFEAGQSGKYDLLRFKSQMAQNTQDMVEAINQLEQSFLTLNQLLNNPIAMEIDVDDIALGIGIYEQYNYDELFGLLDDPSLREPFVAFLIAEAYKNAPELKSIDFNLDATNRNIRLNGLGRLLPTFAVQGQYNSTFNRSGAGSTAPVGFGLVDNYYTASLNVSIPIINQNLSNINRQTAIIQKEQLEINKANTELGIAASVRNGVYNLVNQISNIKLSKVSEEAAKESLELTQTSYSNGAVNIVQLIDAQNNYLTAQLSQANASYNYLINALQLERFLGYYFLLHSDEENNAFRQRFFEFLNTQN